MTIFSLLSVFTLLLAVSSAFHMQLGMKRNQVELKKISEKESHDIPDCSFRRRFFFSLPLIAAVGTGIPQKVKAEWVQFPAKNGLANTYHFMRAGESLLEQAGILATNPLFLTNRENGLSSTGEEQIHEVCRIMEEKGINPSVVKFSLAANAMDTADIIAMDLRVGRNRLVPEYTYMDQRGAGKWDMLPLQTTQDAIWAMDVEEGGTEGLGGRPPAHDDGTPNETIANQVTRLRQLFSLLETSLSGDEILLIFPDATGPAVMTALIAGMPLNRVHEIAYAPGELRIDINYHTARTTWPATPSDEYSAAIARGQSQLSVLRSTDPSTILNVQEQEYLKVQLEAEQENAANALARKVASHDQDSGVKVREYQQRVDRRRELHMRETAKDAERAKRRADVPTDQGPVDTASVLVLGIASALVAWKDNSEQDEIVLKRPAVGIAQISTLEGTVMEAIESDETELKETMTPFEFRDSSSINVSTMIDSTPNVVNGLVDPKVKIWESQRNEAQFYELETLETKIKLAPVEIPGYQSRSQMKTERVALAQQAMDQYMSSDDGGEAWLENMSALARGENDSKEA